MDDKILVKKINLGICWCKRPAHYQIISGENRTKLCDVHFQEIKENAKIVADESPVKFPGVSSVVPDGTQPGLKTWREFGTQKKREINLSKDRQELLVKLWVVWKFTGATDISFCRFNGIKHIQIKSPEFGWYVYMIDGTPVAEINPKNGEVLRVFRIFKPITEFFE